MHVTSPNPGAPATVLPFWLTDDALTGLVDLGNELGFDLSLDLKRHGLFDQAHNPGKAMMPFTSFVELLEDIAERHNCLNFGFLFGRAQKPLSYGLLSQFPKLSSNFGEAFKWFSKYSRLYSGSFSWRIDVEDGVAIMRRDERAGYHRPMIQMITYSVTNGFRSLKNIVGEQWSPDGIYFTHDPPHDVEPMRRYFQTPIFFRAEFSGLVFPQSDLQYPIATSNPELLASLVAFLDNLLAADPPASSLKTRVTHAIKSQLGGQGSTLDSIAHRFGMHPRAFQRALAAEHLSFRQLYNKAMVEVAVHLLGSSRATVSDIAYMLGFAHPSALARAVKVQTGLTPSQFRQSARQSGVK